MKIKPNKFTDSLNIIKSRTSLDDYIRFSFQYVDQSNDKFKFCDCETVYFIKVIERLKNLCAWKMKDFISCRSDALKANYIEWSLSSEPNGFSHILNTELWAENSREFSISRNEYGRIEGFIIDNTFYIVWFDRSHKLFPAER